MGKKFAVFCVLGTLAFANVAGAAEDHGAEASGAETRAPYQSVRRTPAQLARAGVTNMYKLPKFEGVGFALGREGVFRNNVKLMSDFSYSPNGQTGTDLLNALKKYTRNKGCIPNLLIAGHGWGAEGNKRETIATGSTSRDNNLGFNLEGKGATIKGDLARLVKSGEVKFCKSCEVFLHACSISHDYSETLAQVTGCSVVSATYKVSPVDTDSGIYDHVWFTSAGGKFFKYTPHEDGKVSRKMLGEEYVFDAR
jgi:hypothetical protein